MKKNPGKSKRSATSKRKADSQRRMVRRLIKAAQRMIAFSHVCGERQPPGSFRSKISDLEMAVQQAEKALEKSKKCRSEKMTDAQIRAAIIEAVNDGDRADVLHYARRWQPNDQAH